MDMFNVIFSTRWLLLFGMLVELLGYTWLIVTVGGADPSKQVVSVTRNY